MLEHEGAVAGMITELMPEVVDHVTPDGQVPDGTALLASVESLAKRLGV